MASPDEPAKVLVIYTGGTIGMTRNERNALVPIANEFERQVRRYPGMHDPDYAGQFNDPTILALPFVEGERRRIVYTIREYSPLLDSSNMGVHEWLKIAEDIEESYEEFDSFVILHGTDTLCFTASALSFMLENLGKPVIVTGAQIPIFETRTDGKDNFIAALILAGRNSIPEVCVVFNNQLFRGNRTVKESNNTLNPFRSPNAPPLARLGVDIVVDEGLILRHEGESTLKVFRELNTNVDLIYMHPFISTETVVNILRFKEGAVLLTYGAGNIPTNRPDLMAALQEAAQDKLIVNCTQCYEGHVSEIYEAGQELEQSGVVSGMDMTLEAALVKLSYVLGKGEWSYDEKKRKMKSSLRGELTASGDRT